MNADVMLDFLDGYQKAKTPAERQQLVRDNRELARAVLNREPHNGNKVLRPTEPPSQPTTRKTARGNTVTSY